MNLATEFFNLTVGPRHSAEGRAASFLSIHRSITIYQFVGRLLLQTAQLHLYRALVMRSHIQLIVN